MSARTGGSGGSGCAAGDGSAAIERTYIAVKSRASHPRLYREALGMTYTT